MRAELSEWKIAIDLPSRMVEAFSFFHRRPSIYSLAVDKAGLISSFSFGSQMNQTTYLCTLIPVYSLDCHNSSQQVQSFLFLIIKNELIIISNFSINL